MDVKKLKTENKYIHINPKTLIPVNEKSEGKLPDETFCDSCVLFLTLYDYSRILGIGSFITSNGCTITLTDKDVELYLIEND